jgi:hypothetical protein
MAPASPRRIALNRTAPKLKAGAPLLITITHAASHMSMQLSNTMKTFELISILLFGLILGIAVLTGLKLDDHAQQLKEDTWHKYIEANK